MPKQYLNINSFARGINTVKNPRDLAVGEAVDLVNFDVSNIGELRPRGKFDEQTNSGEAYKPGSNNTPTIASSVNPGYGLHYFEYDDESGVAGFSLTGITPTGDVQLNTGSNPYGNVDGTSNNYYVSFIPKGDTQPDFNIAVPPANLLIIGVRHISTASVLTNSNNSLLNSHDDIPIKIEISGTTNNNGIFTIQRILSTNSAASSASDRVIVPNYNGHEITTKGSADGATAIELAEDVTAEDILASATITIKRVGVQDDIAILYGNTDDNKIDVYKDSTGDVTADVIDLETISSTSSYPNWVFYSVNSAVRVADGNRQNMSKPKWYGYIKRDHFYAVAGNEATAAELTSFTSRVIPSNLYAEDNDLAKPTGGDVIGTVNGSNEFAADGIGWSLAIEEHGSNSGGWEATTYEFASTFIYDGNQESLLNKLDTTFTASNGFRKLLINVFASQNVASSSTTFSNRISGGRIYIRKGDGRGDISSGEDWTLLADINIKDGVRVSMLSDYKQWVQDSTTQGLSGDHHFRVTDPNSTTVGNRASAYWMLELENQNLETYTSLNGFSQSTKQISFGQSGSSYKTATISGRRTFVANVKYDEGESGSINGLTEFSSYGDRIMYSEIGKYDTFPNFNYIEASKGDAENYVKLESFADRILAFKQRTMQVINVASSSPNNWFVEDTIYNAGVLHPYSVAKGNEGVIWANRNGVFYFNGSTTINVADGKINDEDWVSFSEATSGAQNQMSVGYISDKNQAIIIQKVNAARHGYVYDIKNQAFSYADDIAPNSFNDTVTNGASFTPVLTNFINDSRGRLVTSYDVQATDLAGEGANKVYTTNFKSEPSVHKDYRVQTPDFPLGQTSLIKKFYKLYIHYRHTASTLIPASNIYYQINQNGTWTAFSSGSFVQSSGNYKVAVFSPSSTVSFQSISFKIDITEGTNSWDTDTSLYINDMQVEYRALGLKQVSAG